MAGASRISISRVDSTRALAPTGDLPGIAENLTEHYEQDGRLALRTLSEEYNSEFIAEQAQFGRDYHRAWCERVFSPYLDTLGPDERARRLAQFVAVCDVYVWKLLRLDAGLSRDQYSASLLELLEPLARRT